MLGGKKFGALGAQRAKPEIDKKVQPPLDTKAKKSLASAGEVPGPLRAKNKPLVEEVSKQENYDGLQGAEGRALSSKAARDVVVMKTVLAQIGAEESPLPEADFQRLYALWKQGAPGPSRSEVVLHQDAFRARHLKEYKKWLKANPQGTEVPQDERTGSFVTLGATYVPDRETPHNLPEIPTVLKLLFEENDGLLQKARQSFLLALDGISYKPTPAGKLARVFSLVMQERDRVTTQAEEVKERNQLEGASLALLTYGIMKPVLQVRHNRDGSDTEKIGFSLNSRLLERHIEVFLAQQQYQRIEKTLKKETNPEKRALLEERLQSLASAKEDADMFISNIARSSKIKEPATIFETVGNRLRVNASELPVFDTEQEGDSAPGLAIKNRSLDASLRILEARMTPDEKKFVSEDLIVRAAEFSNRLQFSATSLDELSRIVARLSENKLDTETRFIARRVLSQIGERAEEVQTILESTWRTLNSKNASPQSLVLRKEKFESLLHISSALAQDYEELYGVLGTLLFPEVTAPIDVSADEEKSQMIALLEGIDADREAVLQAILVKLKAGVSRKELIAALESSEK